MATLDALGNASLDDFLVEMQTATTVDDAGSDDGLSDEIEAKIEAAETCEITSDCLTSMIDVANESVGLDNQAAIVRALETGFHALMRSQSLEHMRLGRNMPAMESQQHQLSELTIAMTQSRRQLMVANEALFEDVIKWFDTIGESYHNKMTTIAMQASSLLNVVKALKNTRPSVSTFSPASGSDVINAGDSSPSGIAKGYDNIVELIKYLNEEFPALFRQLCHEAVELYMSTSSLATGVMTTLGGADYIFFCINITIGLLFALLAAPGLLVGIGLHAAISITFGDVIDGGLRWLVEKIPNERRSEFNKIIDGTRDRLRSNIESYLSDFGKSTVSGNRVFAMELGGKKPLLDLQRDEHATASHNYKVPTKQEMIGILEAIIDSAEHYTSSGKATERVNRIIDDTEKSFGVSGSKHSLSKDALSYNRQAVRQASTSLYFKTEGLYRKPMAALCKHQVRSAKALIDYVEQALRLYH